MKTLIVTSDITYVPQNQQPLFEELFTEAAPHIAGLVVLRVVSPGLLKQIAGLYLAGCTNFATCLAKNIISLPLKKRKALWKAHGLPILRARSMNEPRIIQWVKENDIDLIVNIRTRCVYREGILNTPRLGCVNVHHGILPKYQGTFCDLHALSENRPAGFTIHRMNEEIDMGEILFSKEVSTGNEKNYIKYLSTTGTGEGKALVNLINYVAEHGALPKGLPNRHNKPIITKTPQSKAEIKNLQAKGMVL